MPTLSTPALFIFSGSDAAMESFFFTSMAPAVPDDPPEGVGSLLLTQPERDSAAAMVRAGKTYRVRMVSFGVQRSFRAPATLREGTAACSELINSCDLTLLFQGFLRNDECPEEFPRLELSTRKCWKRPL